MAWFRNEISFDIARVIAFDLSNASLTMAASIIDEFEVDVDESIDLIKLDIFYLI